MTANEAHPIIEPIFQQMQDLSERKKLETKILGAVESYETIKAQIRAQISMSNYSLVS